jgi:tetratricopeptide (TPR) repeat protein
VVVRHLLRRCALCQPKLARYAPFLNPAEPEPDLPVADDADYDSALDRVLNRFQSEQDVRAEDNAARDLLLGKLSGKGLTLAEIIAAFPEELPGRARVEVLIALSFEARYRDLTAMLFLATAAQAAALNLASDPEHRIRYTPKEVADLQARAWAEVANAHRVCEDNGLAEGALAEAERCRSVGSGDPLLLARLLDVKASLRTDQRRLEEADSLLDRVYEIYVDAGEPHLAGRALVSKGNCLYYGDRHQEAACLLEQGLAMLEPQEDPRLVASSQMALLVALERCDQPQRASQLLFESGLRQAFAAEPFNLLKLSWVEARIFAGLGKLKRAEKALSEVEVGFLAEGLEYEAALVSLERAGVLLRMGRTAEVETVAQEALETFQAMQVSREALRAVGYLQEACRQKTATVAVVRQVVDFLQRLQTRPYLRFVPA